MMSRFLQGLLALTGLLGANAVGAQSKAPPAPPELALRSDLWCPYNCEPNAARPGYLVELVKAALPTTRIDYRLGRWTELRNARSEAQGPLMVLLGVSQTPPNERDYLFVRPAVVQAQTCAYRRAQSPLGNWRLRDPGDVRGLRLGVTQGYLYHPDIDALLLDPATRRSITQVAGERASMAHARMLSLGRVDVVLEERTVMQWALRQPGVAPDIVEAGCLERQAIDALYLVVPRNDPRSPAWVEALQDGLQRVQQNGEMQRLREVYGLPAMK